jgi:hypothetical protein
MPQAAADAAIDLVLNLERVEDIRTLTALLRSADR